MPSGTRIRGIMPEQFVLSVIRSEQEIHRSLDKPLQTMLGLSQSIETAAYELAGDIDQGFVSRMMLMASELEQMAVRISRRRQPANTDQICNTEGQRTQTDQRLAI